MKKLIIIIVLLFTATALADTPLVTLSKTLDRDLRGKDFHYILNYFGDQIMPDSTFNHKTKSGIWYFGVKEARLLVSVYFEHDICIGLATFLKEKLIYQSQ